MPAEIKGSHAMPLIFVRAGSKLQLKTGTAMLITTTNEIQSLMPTARWDRPEQLFGWLEEEGQVALEPLLGPALYQHLIQEYGRLHEEYGDITATTVRPTGEAKADARLAHADITERLEQISEGKYRETFVTPEPGVKDVRDEDMRTIRLILICQQIEFYRMISHKAGMLTVSFNEGGGMNVVTADGYDPAEEKRMDRVVKDAYMSAGRSTDSLLLFLEADAKGARQFTEKWKEADAFWLHRDLLFQTAKVLNEYLDIKGERMSYVQLVRDIRFCQGTYLKPRIGMKLLKAVIAYANDGTLPDLAPVDGVVPEQTDEDRKCRRETWDELTDMLRQALAFYVEARRTAITHMSPLSGSGTRSGSYMKDDSLARRDSTTDAQQAMAAACDFVADNIYALGTAVTDTPIYNQVREREAQEQRDAADAEAARRRMCCRREKQNRKKLFTAFPATHIRPDHK